MRQRSPKARWASPTPSGLRALNADAHALGEQSLDDAAADTTTGSGDDGGLAGESEIHAVAVLPLATTVPPQRCGEGVDGSKESQHIIGSMTDLVVQSHLDGLLTVDRWRPHLVGGRCGQCATDTFPRKASCPRCGSEEMTAVALASRGSVWTWTVQRFEPKAPFRAARRVRPFALAYVDLGTVRVESRLAGKAVDSWRIGDAVRLVVGAMYPTRRTGKPSGSNRTTADGRSNRWCRVAPVRTVSSVRSRHGGGSGASRDGRRRCAVERFGFAVGGSRDGGHADALVKDLGLTGTPFMSVYNGCATGGSALLSGANAIAAGMADLVLVVGFDKHDRGAFATDPAEYGLDDWFGEMGLMVTTQFFGMKIQRYLDQHDLDPRLLAELSAKALRNGHATRTRGGATRSALTRSPTPTWSTTR